MPASLNAEIAQRLEEVARLLEDQGANPFRVRAYQQAAQTIRHHSSSVRDLYEREGMEGLRRLPRLGESLARAVRDLIVTGRLPMLDRLRGESDPIAVLASVPGIGQALAARLHDELGIDSLEELEMAAHDGRLADIGGIGEKKLAGIIDSLAGRLGRVRGKGGRDEAAAGEPPVGELLKVDAEYREKAEAGTLRKIAPHRFNPKREAWLPVMHTQRGDRHYTALFSNTARAHERARTHDWVILYYDHEGGESQCTVITSERGAMKGRRIVRGREEDCAAHYGTG